MARNGLGDAYIRVVVTRAGATSASTRASAPTPTVVHHRRRRRLYPESLYETGLRAVTVSLRRTAVDALSPRVKSLNYLNNILAKWQAIG